MRSSWEDFEDGRSPQLQSESWVKFMGPHDPCCIFVLCFRAEHVLYSYVLHFRPEAEIYVEMSCLCKGLHLQVTHRCWTSSRIDEI